MILCLVLLRLVVVLAVKIAADALFGAGRAAYRFWTRHKLGARLFPKWAKRRAMKSWIREHGGPPDEISEPFFNDDPTSGRSLDSDPKEVHVSEATQSFLRGIAKVLAGALVTKGVIDVGDAGALQVVIETLAAGLVGAVAFYLSHRKHA